MIDFTGSFAPLALLSPLLVALAVAFFFTNKLSARIAKRNAEEEAEMRMAQQTNDEEVVKPTWLNDSIWAKPKMWSGALEIPSPLAAEPYATVRRAECQGRSKIKSRGKSKVVKGSPRHKTV